MLIISWNIDSLNAALTSDSNRAKMSQSVLDKIMALDPDVLAIQETKLREAGPSSKHQEILAQRFPHHHVVWHSSHGVARKGYAGTMFLYKEGIDAIVTKPEIDGPEPMDSEGRIITLELDNCYLTNVYTPNAGSQLGRLEERQAWDLKYADYLATLDKQKPVIAMGDFNVAHEEIDLAHPANNHFSAGFTDEERQGFTHLLSQGFVDTFRHLHGSVEGVYTWWAQRVKTSKINNSGWRIDYFLVSERLKDDVKRSEMIDSGDRQDHTPILLEIDL